MRDGIARLLGESEGGADALSRRIFVAYTCTIVAVAALVGVFCKEVEVVLAYKGGIFGSLMVYVLPALMHVALVDQRDGAAEQNEENTTALEVRAGEQLLAEERCGNDEVVVATPKSVGDTIRSMFTARKHAICALLFAWGVASGTLSVVVTSLKQANVQL